MFVLKRIAVIIALLVSTAAVIYALYLLSVGYEVIGVYEGFPQVNPTVFTNHVRPLAAIIPLLASLSIITGLLFRRNFISWIGLALLSAFAFLFVFSIGGILIPFALVLFILLIIIQWK